MTVAEAMGSIPEAVGSALGPKPLARCFSQAGLSPDVPYEEGNFVPQIAIDRFLHSAARQSGDEFFGANLAASVSVRDYGIWGDYVLEAPTLSSALIRATSVIHLHADNDTLTLQRRANSLRFEYGFGERGGEGYRQIAMAAIGALVSIPRHYLGKAWQPLSMGLDLGDRRVAKHLESKLKSRMRTDDTAIAIEIANADLLASNPVQDIGKTTHEDVVRACRGGPPKGIVSILEQLLLQRMGTGSTRLEDMAKTLDVSRRTLQRRLDREGVDFRSLSSAVRMKRAVELLKGSELTISAIASLLEYSTPSHFARAFRQSFNVAPAEYRSLGVE